MYNKKTNKPKMKLLPLALLLPLTFAPISTQAQQVNVYAERYCYTNVEQYVPGYYDAYGRYVGGYVNRTRNRVPCSENVVVNTQPQYNQQQYYQRQRVCNPNNAAYGAALGYGLGSALSGGSGWNRSGSYNRYHGRNYSSGNWNNSYRNKSGWSVFGAGLGALMFSC
jgi:hypothetical protein